MEQIMNKHIVDLSGKTFGKITVISFSRMENRISYWNCFCSCDKNKILELGWHQIKNRKFPNCGCSNTGWKRNNCYDLSGEYGICYIGDSEEFYFDLEDYDKIKDISWFVNDHDYIAGKINYKSIRMHRLIMDFPEKLCIDHINGNKHDNRKNNLRITTKQGNAQNKINKIKGTSSKYFGVCKDGNKWLADIKMNKKHYYLGRFDTEEEAALAYNKKAEELGFLTRNIIEEAS
jgi:hypothetical protein